MKQQDLRNKNKPLLRRLQRQIEDRIPKPKQKIINLKVAEDGFTTLGLEEDVILKIPDTKLNLYNRRLGR